MSPATFSASVVQMAVDTSAKIVIQIMGGLRTLKAALRSTTRIVNHRFIMSRERPRFPAFSEGSGGLGRGGVRQRRFDSRVQLEKLDRLGHVAVHSSGEILLD